MARAFVRTTKKVSDSYAARKSHNEVYYQMASVFKQVIKRDDKHTDKILSKLLSANKLHVSLEKAG